jgi:hypothetical protein
MDETKLEKFAKAAEGKLTLNELVLSDAQVSLPGWAAAEPAIALSMVVVTAPPFEEAGAVLAEVGLHALARRYERAPPNADADVLRDIKAPARHYDFDAAGAAEFAVPTPCGGRWIGAVRRATGAETPVFAVRTFLA